MKLTATRGGGSHESRLCVAAYSADSLDRSSSDARSATAPPAQVATPPRVNIELGAGASFSATALGPAAIRSPDAAVLVFVAQKAAGEKPQLYVRRLDQQRDGYLGPYLGSGHLAYMHGGTLFVAPFDLTRLE
jgi:hypothetical protein